MFFFVKVNQKVINVFYPSLKMKVKVVSVNIKIGTLKIVFLAISLNLFEYKRINTYLKSINLNLTFLAEKMKPMSDNTYKKKIIL